MKITVVGCFGAYPLKDGATSGYLLEDGTTKVLLDCGSGVIASLQNYISLDELDAVVFSHYHRDHCADLECLQHAAMVGMLLKRRKQPLIMWGNKTHDNAPALHFENYCQGKYFTEYEPFEVGSLRFTAQANVHDVPAYCLKVEDSQGGCIAYSGDTGYYDRICDFVAGVDWFICECSLYAEQRGQVQGHLSATEAGLIAAKANVKNLLLTHLPPYGNREMLVKQAADFYTGNTVLAYKGMVISSYVSRIANCKGKSDSNNTKLTHKNSGINGV